MGASSAHTNGHKESCYSHTWVSDVHPERSCSILDDGEIRCCSQKIVNLAEGALSFAPWCDSDGWDDEMDEDYARYWNCGQGAWN